MRILLLLCLSSTAFAFAERVEIGVTAILPAGVDKAEVQASFSLDGDSQSHECWTAKFSNRIYTCTIFVVPGKHVFLFKYAIRGYKPYSVYVTDFTVTSSANPTISLGELHLLDATGPRIENIVRSTADDGSIRYEITIHNLSKRRILFTRLAIDAADEVNCEFPPLYPAAYYKMSDELKLTFVEDGKVELQGKVADLGDHAEFVAPVTGNGFYDECGRREIHIFVPVSAVLPEESFLKIGVIVPAVKNSTSARKSEELSSRNARSSRSTPLDVPTVYLLERFRHVYFTLTTSDKEWHEINAHFSHNWD